MKRTRVVTADDHRVLMDAIKGLLEPEYDVVGTFPDGESLVAAAPALEPDLVVIDVGMPKMNGLNACGRLKKLMPKVKVIFLTMDRDPETAGEAFRSGASAYVLKTAGAADLKAAIKEALRGGYYATASLTEGMTGSFVQKLKSTKSRRGLTLRQKEVLQLLAEGYSMKQVALALNISHSTVAFHKYSMMEHLGVTSSAELMSYAAQYCHSPLSPVRR